MNCQDCCEELAAYLEGLLDEPSQSRMDGHLAECAACQAELHAVRELTVRLTRDGLATPPVSLETVVMDRILQQQAFMIRRLKMRKRIRLFGISGAMVAAAAMLFIGGLWLAPPAEAQRAAETMARGAEAVANPSTVHILAKMRTRASENFSYIDADADFLPVEIWKQFGEQPKWRVERRGRVAVMDGTSTIMLIRRSNTAVKIPSAQGNAFDTYWMLGVANVEDLLTRALTTSQAKGWKLKQTEETTPAGQKLLVVAIEAKAGVPENDEDKNHWFDSSDMRRVYRFDAKTQRLEGFEAYIHQPGGDVLVFTTERIDYNRPIAPTVFALDLPKDVAYYKEPERLPDNEKYEKMSPKEAARAFFDACGKEDWNEVAKFDSPITERDKSHLGGLEIVSIGEPFQTQGYARVQGWLIPYEIKLKNGEIRKHRLAMRKDNPANRYIVDGGSP
jgi:hypothetical protein